MVNPQTSQIQAGKSGTISGLPAVRAAKLRFPGWILPK
jgi:hypothetical protein